MRRSIIITFVSLLLLITGYGAVPSLVMEGLKSIHPPKGSTISYVHLPAISTLLASDINHTPKFFFTNSCYAMLIDEQPQYDFEHMLHLLTIAEDGTTTSIFHGNGFPDFRFQRNDGSWITGKDWEKY